MRSDGGAQRFWKQTGVVAAIGALAAVALAAAFLSIGHSPQPRDVPVAVVGPPAVAQQFEAKAPGTFSARSVPDVAAGQTAIDERDVYAVVVPGSNGIRELLISPAANNQVANFMRRTLGQATETNVPRIVDAKPLPKDDSSGQSIGFLIQVLMIGGSLGVVGIARVLPRFRGDPRRGVLPLTSLVGYGLLLGLLLTVVSAAFGVGTDAAFIDRVLAFTLIGLAVTTSTGALVALMGAAGAGLASLVYFVLGAQISGAGTAPEFLPPFWSDLGQALPGGAGTSLLRDVFYFPQASTGEPIAILAAYVAVGLVVVIALSALARRRSRASGGARSRGRGGRLRPPRSRRSDRFRTASALRA
jgi:hypothetical protein